MIKTNVNKTPESYRIGWEMAVYKIESLTPTARRDKKSAAKRVKDN